jgi:SAM-dependent methyltransferase
LAKERRVGKSLSSCRELDKGEGLLEFEIRRAPLCFILDTFEFVVADYESFVQSLTKGLCVNNYNNDKMTSEDELKGMAAQFRGPAGPRGIEVANYMNEINAMMTKSTIETLALKAGDRILEIGHGNAGHLPLLLEAVPTAHYDGLETSELMKSEAAEKNVKYVVSGQAAFHIYDGSVIPFEDSSFDKIFSVNTIYFWANPASFVTQLYRVLRSGGLISITFAQREFMEKLPFTRFAFELYDTPKALELLRSAPWTFVEELTKSEHVKSTTGELVERVFTTLIFKK